MHASASNQASNCTLLFCRAVSDNDMSGFDFGKDKWTFGVRASGAMWKACSIVSVLGK